ncbi:MlaD family protein [Pseudonocardia sp. GCM10023141]|uniref:MlaD family protein n=1 Tax=Pseudonocardia sp. GCM10023141 TaxID=3252653 RepID=UPI00360C448E
MTERGAWLKVIAFLVIGLLAAVLVGAQTMSRDVLGGGKRITVQMPDAGGLLPASLVTYRGVKVGTVKAMDVRLGGAGVTATLSLTTDLRIPAATTAVVAMDTPVAIEHLDLQPDTDTGPYLEDGSVIAEDRTVRPLALERVLADAYGTLSSINTADLHTTADELAVALQGMGPQLQSLLANSMALIDTADTLTPQIIDLTTKGNQLLRPTSLLVSRLPQLAATLKDLSGQVSGQLDNVSTVVDRGNELADRLIPLMHDNQEGAAAILANGAAVGQVLSVRTAALNTGFATIPRGFDDLASVFVPVPGGATGARVKFVATLGPVCYYDAQRRLPQDTAPMPVEPNWSCAGDQPYVQQRGAANVPTPGRVGTYDPQSGAATTGDGTPVQLGQNGGQNQVLGARSWSSLLLQGVQ